MINILIDRAKQKARHYIRLAEEPKEEMIRDYSAYKKPSHVPYEIWVEKMTNKIIEDWSERKRQ